MAISSYDSTYSIGSTRVIVPVGATLALFMSPVAGQINTILKYSSGGTCEILSAGFTQTSVGVFLGTTQSPSALASASGFGYCFGVGEVLTIQGPACYYLSSTGATTVLHMLTGKGQGQ